MGCSVRAHSGISEATWPGLQVTEGLKKVSGVISKEGSSSDVCVFVFNFNLLNMPV